MKKPKNRTEKKILTRGRTIALISAFLLGMSAFLPWGYNPRILVTGLVGDGWIIVGLGILAFLLLFIKRIHVWISFVLGATGLIVGIMDISAMNRIVKIVSGQIGSGLYLTIIASACMVLGTAIEMYDDRKRRKNIYFADV